MSALPDVQMFYGTATADARSWDKPLGKSMAYLFAIGGAGGGGGGFSAAAAAARGGGGGGASGTTARLMIPLACLPNVLRISPGGGGLGVGSGGGTAGSGGASTIGLMDTSANTLSLLLFARGGGGGGTGTGAAAGAAGAGGAISTLADCVLAGPWVFASFAGEAGAIGGSPAGGVAGPTRIPGITPGPFAIQFQGGAGGAGVTGADVAGGICTVAVGGMTYEGQSLGAAAGSNNGPGGRMQWASLTGGTTFSYAGLGGSSSNAGIGGAGGNGGYGSGGGGGGGGTTGGRGGDGGPGLVIIVCV